MRLCLLLIMLFLYGSVFASSADTIKYYLNYHNERCSIATEICYYRYGYKENDNWILKQYYVKDTSVVLQMFGSYSDSNLKIQEGRFEWYTQNGHLHKKGQYLHGKKVGLWKEWHDNGLLHDSTFYINDLPGRWSYNWDRDGNLFLKGQYNEDGSGAEWCYYPDNSLLSFGKYAKGYVKDSVWTYYHENGGVSSIENYQNGKLLDYTCYTENGNIQENNCDTSSSPKATFDIVTYIVRTLKYPRQARENGNEGVVEVAFAVNKDGSISDVSTGFISYRISQDCINEAIRIIKAMPNWKPIKVHNVAHKIFYTIAVNFRLTD